MTSSGNARRGGKRRLGFPAGARHSRCGALPFVRQQTAPGEGGSAKKLHDSLGSPEMSASPPETGAAPWASSRIFWAGSGGIEQHAALVLWVCAPTRPHACCQQVCDTPGRPGNISSAGRVQQPQAVTLQHRIWLQGCSQGIAPQLRWSPRTYGGPDSGVMGWPRLNSSLGCSLFNQSVLRCQGELPYLTGHWKTHSGGHIVERLVINDSTTALQSHFL